MDGTKDLQMGDTVRLSFGGPTMTVLSVSDDRCCCMWFGESGKFEHGEFEVDVIEFVERPEPLLPRDTRYFGASTKAPAEAGRRQARSQPHD